MPEYKLYYGKGKGYGELSRMLFALGELEFTDVRMEDGDEKTELINNSPYGANPNFEIDGVMYGKNVAIARYVAKKVDLYGKTDIDQLKTDAIVDYLYQDVMGKLIGIYLEKDEEKKANLTEEGKDFVKNTAVGKLEKQIEGENTFLASGLSWADVAVFNFFHDLYTPFFKEDAFEGSPILKKHSEHVASLPLLKKHLETRAVTEF